MMIFGRPDCANAEEETKTQAISTRGRRNFLKILSLFEQKSDCDGLAAKPQFWNSPDTLEKSRRSGIRTTSVASCRRPVYYTLV